MKKIILIVLVCSFIQTSSSLFGAAALDSTTASASSLSSHPTNGLIIILEDAGFGEVGVNTVAQAILQKASPLVVSASIIEQIYKICTINPDDLKKRIEEFKALPSDIQQTKEVEALEIYIAGVGFDAQTADEWVIKEINSSLYLLLHKNYLAEKKISLDAVTEYHDKTVPLTPLEMQLGLKVNHMKTVKAATIKKPTRQPIYAYYFTEALQKNSLFVSNSEYTQEYSQYRPLWAIFILGHGLMHASVAGMVLDEFKDFLSFLEYKVSTKLLYYATCFGAGENSNRLYSSLYSDTKKRIDKTYSFAIITQALTDAIVGIRPFETNLTQFLQKATTSDCINYRELAACVLSNFDEKKLVNSIPQIKFPGLEWFSVIDESKVVSIGSVLAKTRTEPLDIGTFFKKKGKQAEPLALLLYTQSIPFELIINTSGWPDSPPHIISMIPGEETFHTIKKISSNAYPIETLVDSFLPLEGLEMHKTFVIGDIEGTFSNYMHTRLPAAAQAHANQDTIDSEKWVIIDYVSAKYETSNYLSFTYNSEFYSMPLNQKTGVIGSNGITEDYYLKLIQKAMRQQPPSSEWIKQYFEQPFTTSNYQYAFRGFIYYLFKMMPYDTALQLPELKLEANSYNTSTRSYLYELLQMLCEIYYNNEGKSIHFDKLMIGSEEKATDLVFSIAKDATYGEVSYKEGSKTISLKRDCYIHKGYKRKTDANLPEPQPLAELSIDKRSVHEHVTPETTKTLTSTLSKDKRETWRQKFLGIIKNDARWIKVGEEWIENSPISQKVRAMFGINPSTPLLKSTGSSMDEVD